MPVRINPRAGTEKERDIEFIKREFEYRRGITPFVCSTGEDFQHEHHLLSSRVFPELHRVCQERGIFFSPTELKWCKNHPLTEKGHLLKTAFNFIERCAPFYLCLLGERYGYHRDTDEPLLCENSASHNWVDDNLLIAAKSGHDWVLEESVQYRSLTELQILYAAFKSCPRRNLVYEEAEIQCFFYYRQPEHKDALFTDLQQDERLKRLQLYEPESDYCNRKCRSLKQDIIKKGHSVHYFQTAEELCNLVLQDWKYVIDEFAPPIYDSLNITNEKEKDIYLHWLQHECFAEHKRDMFRWFPEYEDLSAELTRWALTAMDEPPVGWDKVELDSEVVKATKESKGYVEAKYQSIIGIVGDRGSGKSSFIAHWVREFQQQYGFLNVFVHYAESCANSSNVVTMLKRCMAYFSNQLQHNYECIDEKCLRENNLHSLGEVFSASISHKPCLIILDGLDELGKGDNDAQVRDLSWLLYPLPPHVRLIVTTCRSDISYTALSKRPDTTILPMPVLKSNISQTTVLDVHLGTMAGRLDVRYMLQHCRLADRALFLQLIATEAQQYDIFTDFEDFVEHVLEKTSVRDLLNMLVSRWIDTYSWPAVSCVTPKSSRSVTKPDPAGESGGWVADVLRLLVVSRQGLNVPDLLELLEYLGYHGETRVTHYDVMMFLDHIHGVIVFESPDGLLRFNHQHLKEGVEHTLLSPLTIDIRKDLSTSSVLVPRKNTSVVTTNRQLDKKIYHTYLADYFAMKPHCERRTRELPWQLHGSKDYRRLHDTLSEPRLFMDLMSNVDTRLDLCLFWEWLLTSSDYKPGSTYTDMMAMLIHDQAVPDIVTSQSASVPGDMSPLYASTAREFASGDAPPPTPRLDVHELGKYTAQFLLIFECYEAALQIALTAFNKLSQICPLEHHEEQLKCEIEALIGACYQALNMSKNALRWYERAHGTVTDMLAMSMLPRQQRTLKHLKGNVLIELASLQLAREEHILTESLLAEAHKCMLSSDHLIGSARVLLNIGLLKADLRDYFKAHTFLQRAKSEYEKWFGKNHHQVSEALHEFGVLLSNENNTYKTDENQAETLFRRALRLREQAYGHVHLGVAETLFALGQLLKNYKSNLAKNEALSFLQRAYDIHSTKLGPEHTSTKKMYKAMNDLEIAIKYKPQYHVENRYQDLPFSTLSWHESALNDLEMRARRKKAQKNMGTMRASMRAIRAFKDLHLLAKSRVSDNGANQNGAVSGGGMLQMFKKKVPSASNDTPLVQNLGVMIPTTVRQNEDFEYEESGKEDLESEGSESVKSGDVDLENEKFETKEELENEESDDKSVCSSRKSSEMKDLLDDNEEELEKQTELDNEKHVDTVSVDLEAELDIKLQSIEGKYETEQFSHTDAIRVPSAMNEIDVEARFNEVSEEYLDSFSSISQKKKSPRNETASKKKTLRPQSAPFKMLHKYQSIGYAASRASSAVPHARREINSAPVNQHNKHRHGNRSGSHRKRCPPHTPLVFNKCNTFSTINGPHTSTESLLGPKACPRELDLRLQHTSAWYHVPGRYATIGQPYPPKRSQTRVQDAHRKLVPNLHTKSHSKLLLTSTFPTYMNNPPHYLNPTDHVMY